jgi:hypothetical protein
MLWRTLWTTGEHPVTVAGTQNTALPSSPLLATYANVKPRGKSGNLPRNRQKLPCARESFLSICQDIRLPVAKPELTALNLSTTRLPVDSRFAGIACGKL